jgi:hypothetical protein
MTQIAEAPTSVQSIMAHRNFKAGVDDVRAGRPARFDAFDDNLWAYERGRQWATLAPMTMPLRIGKKLNPAAIALFRLNYAAIR